MSGSRWLTGQRGESAAKTPGGAHLRRSEEGTIKNRDLLSTTEGQALLLCDQGRSLAPDRGLLDRFWDDPRLAVNAPKKLS